MKFVQFIVACYIFLQVAFLPAQEPRLCSSNNCYSIIEMVGEGAFSKVFSVENLQGEKLALKTYVNKSQSFLQDCDPEREFLIGKTLDHPNIIKSLELFSTTSSDGSVSDYLILQFCNGKTLRSIEKNALLYQEAKHIIIQLLDALSYSLSQGKIYTDFHEENILITQNFDIMIVDLSSFYTTKEMTCSFFQNPYFNEQDTFAYYLETLTEFINRIIKKSNLERTRKLTLCAEFKKIGWNFKEDVEEGKEVFISDCFDQFLLLL